MKKAEQIANIELRNDGAPGFIKLVSDGPPLPSAGGEGTGEGEESSRWEGQNAKRRG